MNKFEETLVQTTDVSVVHEATHLAIYEGDIEVGKEVTLVPVTVEEAVTGAIPVVSVPVRRPRRPAHLRLVRPGAAPGPWAAPPITARAHVAAQSPAPLMLWDTRRERHLSRWATWIGATTLAAVTVLAHFAIEWTSWTP